MRDATKAFTQYMNNIKSFARQTASPIFRQIIEDNYRNVLSIEAQLWELGKVRSNYVDPEDYDPEIYKLEKKLAPATITVVVFAAILVEAYFYDYAARNLSDSYVQKYLDKLDTTAKCVIITKLVTGKDFPTHSQAFDLLRKLIKHRNSFVHSKSAPIHFDENSVVKIDNADWKQKVKIAKDAVMAIEMLAQEIESLDNNEISVIWRISIEK